MNSIFKSINMEFSNIKLRSTLFPLIEISIDETWIANISNSIKELGLVSSVRNTFKVEFNSETATPEIKSAFFLEFKRLDNSFKITLMPNRFDIEKEITDLSLSSPLEDFSNEVNSIWKLISEIVPKFSRAALGATFATTLSSEEQSAITNQYQAIKPDSKPSEYIKRIVFPETYTFESESCNVNEVIETSTQDISAADPSLNFGFDFNTHPSESSEIISKHFSSFMIQAAKKLSAIAEKENISKIL